MMIKTNPGSKLSASIPSFLYSMENEKIAVVQHNEAISYLNYLSALSTLGKEKACYDLTGSAQFCHKNIVFTTHSKLKSRILQNSQILSGINFLIIDGVEERSVDCDLFLLLLAEYYRKNKANFKLKIIVSSFTIDQKIEKLFAKVGLRCEHFNDKEKIIR
jgi:hypothetical protein